MSWFYEKWTVPSERNGAIECLRTLGQWTVTVDGCSESSSYMRDLWKTALRRLPRSFSAKRILMLGLAAGSSVDTLHRRFPGCHITAVEWDPVMVDVLKRLRLFRSDRHPEVLLGDATTIVPSLHKSFDLILFDLYQGKTTPEQATRADFFATLKRLLVRDGYLIVNAYQQTKIPVAAKTQFSHQRDWMFRLNRMSLYRPFGAGTEGDPLPEGYVPFRTNSTFLRREWTNHPSTRLIQSGDAWGTRFWSGPFCMEKYHGDNEPLLDPHGPKRLLIWQRTTRLDVVTGWSPSRLVMHNKLTGFVDLTQKEDPVFAWSPHAKRQLTHWEKHRADWEEVSLTLESFLVAYRSSSMPKELKDLHTGILRQKASHHGPLLHLIGLKRRATGTIEAGFASLDIPELHQSVHIASFFLPSAKAEGVGVGLVLGWFQRAERAGLRFCDFDLFRGPHEPRSWIGFSRFKSQFGTRFVLYPLPLVRWTGTWKEYFSRKT